MDPPAFNLFGAPHLTAIGLTLAVPAGLSLLVRRARSEAVTRAVCVCLACLLGVDQIVRWGHVLHTQGAAGFVMDALPLEVCTLAVFLSIAVLLSARAASPSNLAWFWGMAGTLNRGRHPRPGHWLPQVRVLSVLHLARGRRRDRALRGLRPGHATRARGRLARLPVAQRGRGRGCGRESGAGQQLHVPVESAGDRVAPSSSSPGPGIWWFWKRWRWCSSRCCICPSGSLGGRSRAMMQTGCPVWLPMPALVANLQSKTRFSGKHGGHADASSTPLHSRHPVGADPDAPPDRQADLFRDRSAGPKCRRFAHRPGRRCLR